MAAASAAGSPPPAATASAWHERLRASQAAGMPFEAELAGPTAPALAAFIAGALDAGLTTRVLVPDDRALPEFAAAFDPLLRPLCLILPAADFAAGTARRASLALLRSRLWRDGEDGRSAAWEAVRRRLGEAARRVDAWPDDAESDHGLAGLFPALITPRADLVAGIERGGITVLIDCEAPPGLRHDGGALLRLTTLPRRNATTAPVPARQTAALLIERARLTQDIADLELELASVEVELAEFNQDYHRRVGSRMARLDALQAARTARRAAAAPEDAELHAAAAQAAQHAADSAAESARPDPPQDATAQPVSGELRRLFRRLAQQIHPDRAEDAADHGLRTRLMAEANLAYRAGDISRLRRIEAQWQALRPDAAVPGSEGVPRLEQQIDRLRRRLAEIEAELQRIFGSSLYQLFMAARQAARSGRDLLAEMALGIDRMIAELDGEPP